jgi:hypothetical protein
LLQKPSVEAIPRIKTGFQAPNEAGGSWIEPPAKQEACPGDGHGVAELQPLFQRGDVSIGRGFVWLKRDLARAEVSRELAW